MHCLNGIYRQDSCTCCDWYVANCVCAGTRMMHFCNRPKCDKGCAECISVTRIIAVLVQIGSTYQDMRLKQVRELRCSSG